MGLYRHGTIPSTRPEKGSGTLERAASIWTEALPPATPWMWRGSGSVIHIIVQPLLRFRLRELLAKSPERLAAQDWPEVLVAVALHQQVRRRLLSLDDSNRLLDVTARGVRVHQH